MSNEMEVARQLSQDLADVNGNMRSLIAVFRELRDLAFYAIWMQCPGQTFFDYFEIALAQRNEDTKGNPVDRKGGANNV